MIHKLASLLYIQESILKFQICTFCITDSATIVVPLLSLTQQSWELAAILFLFLLMRKLKHRVAVTPITSLV